MHDLLLEVQRVFPEINQIYTDGKFHRFGKSKIFWLVGHEDIQQGGRIYTYVTAGNWQTGEQQTFSSDGKGHCVDYAEAKVHFEKQREQRHAEEAKIQIEAAEKALDLWRQGQPVGIHPYMQKKGITEVVSIRFKGDNILVPCMDNTGKLWGVQRILPTGEKRFTSGQRVKGTYCKLPGNDTKILFCEGYATGFSLWKATGFTTIVCFNAGNLEAVAEGHKSNINDRVICGDDDIETEGNPGRTKAAYASRHASALVFPLFPFVKGKETTDFNDLYLMAGPDAVREQILKAINNKQVIALEESQFDGLDEKLHPNKMVHIIVNKEKLITDKYGITYIYTGTFWKRLTNIQLTHMAKKIDGVYTSQKRRNEVKDGIANETLLEPLTWRNVQPTEIAFNNGVLDLKSWQLRPHRPEDYLETVLPVNFNPEAKCPLWDQCLNDWFGESDDSLEKVIALRHFFGYILMPHANYKKGLILQGESNTGKSQVLGVISKLVGLENVCSISVEDMEDARKIAPIVGKMVNLISELSSSALIKDGGFKKLVSTGDPILVDEKWQPARTYLPFCKHVIATNHLPAINDQSKATRNRLLIIEFTNEIEEEKADRDLLEKLTQELEGIALWAAFGAEQLYSMNGHWIKLQSSDDMLEKHAREQNDFYDFASEKLKYSYGSRTLASQIFRTYNEWRGGRYLSHMSVGKKAAAAGFNTEITWNAINQASSRYLMDYIVSN